MPKKELVTALQLALQTRRLKVATDLEDADLLVSELAAFRLRRVSINEAEAAEWRVNRNDDLVFAVALACWPPTGIRPASRCPPCLRWNAGIGGIACSVPEVWRVTACFRPDTLGGDRPAPYVMGLELGPPGEPTGFAILEEPAATWLHRNRPITCDTRGAFRRGHVPGHFRGGGRAGGVAASARLTTDCGPDGRRQANDRPVAAYTAGASGGPGSNWRRAGRPAPRTRRLAGPEIGLGDQLATGFPKPAAQGGFSCPIPSCWSENWPHSGYGAWHRMIPRTPSGERAGTMIWCSRSPWPAGTPTGIDRSGRKRLPREGQTIAPYERRMKF